MDLHQFSSPQKMGPIRMIPDSSSASAGEIKTQKVTVTTTFTTFDIQMHLNQSGPVLLQGLAKSAT